MQRFLRLAILFRVALGSTLVVGCVTNGPAATNSLESAPTFSHAVLMAPATGVDQPLQSLMSSVLSAKISQRILDTEAMADAIGSSNDDPLHRLLLIRYQAHFAEFARRYGEGERLTKRLDTSSVLFSNMSPTFEASQLNRVLKMVPVVAPEFQSLEARMQQRNYGAVVNAEGRQKAALMVAAKINDFAFRKLGITHLLVSHIEGDRDGFDRGQSVRLSMAVVRLATGKIEFFSSRRLKRNNSVVPYSLLVTSEATELLQFDKIPALRAVR